MDAFPDPLAHLAAWLEAARERGEPDPEAMTLATVSGHGGPATRTVTLKEIDGNGAVFATTLYSRKAHELHANPRVALNFWWPTVRRQVRIEGSAEALDRATAERIFAARGRENQLQTIVSPQGEEIEDLDDLRTALAAAEDRYRDQPVPCPMDWGAVRVVPALAEFWEEAPDRMQDRLEYRRNGGGWDIRLLAP